MAKKSVSWNRLVRAVPSQTTTRYANRQIRMSREGQGTLLGDTPDSGDSCLPKLEGYSVEACRREQVKLTVTVGGQVHSNILWADDVQKLEEYCYRAMDGKTKGKIITLCPWDLNLAARKRTRPIGPYVLRINQRMVDQEIACTMPMTSVRELARELHKEVRRSRQR